jgi:phosphoadenylyl-sulfate reductase (thioredoxin)
MESLTANLEEIDLDRLRSMDAERLLRFAFETFGPRAAIGTSLQKTGVAMIDIASRLDVDFRVFFIDTLLNHDETYELLAEVETRYGITIERFEPDPKDIESLNSTVGQWAHYLARPSCCHVRKRKPLQNALKTLDVWISGLRADQSDHREDQARKADWARDDRGRRILKLNPLLDWTVDQIDRYSREHDLPYNKLYDFVSPYGERYHVIGCTLCHIPTRDGLDRRMGKFPWEQGRKECGLHDHGSGI